MRFAQEISIFNPHAIEMAVVALGTQITQTAEEIRLEAAQTLSNYSTTVQMNAAISTKANEITSEVSQTYATQQSLNNSVSSLSSRITQNANSISTEVTNRTTAVNNEKTARQSADSSLSSRIEQTASSISFTLSGGGTGTNKNKASLSMSYKKEDGTTVNLSAQTITFSGLVSFTDLSNASSSTTINGSHITTGTINGASVILGGSNNTSGTLTIRNSSGTNVGTLNNAGLEVIQPNTLKTSLLSSDGMMHSYRYSSGWLEIGNIGRRVFDSQYQTMGINALSANCSGLTLCINGTPYYAMNTSDGAGQGLDLTGYGFRHYFRGEVYCTSTFKTWCGYGWTGNWSDNSYISGEPEVLTGGNVCLSSGSGYGNLTVNGTIYYKDMQIISDRRKKHNIKPLTMSQSKAMVMGLKPVEFVYNSDKNEYVHHGFIAQDVYEVDAARWNVKVSSKETGEEMGLCLTDFIADMIMVMQEQENRISELERRIA